MQNRPAIIFSLGMLHEKVDIKLFVGRMIEEIKKKTPEVKITPELYAKGLHLSEQFNLGLDPNEFKTSLLAAYGIPDLKEEDFWQAWDAMVVVGDIDKKIAVLEEMALDSGTHYYVTSHTNETHFRKTPEEKLPFAVYPSFRLKKNRADMIEHVVHDIKSKRTPSHIILIHADPANVSDVTYRRKVVEPEFKRISEFCAKNNVTIFTLSFPHTLETTLNRVFAWIDENQKEASYIKTRNLAIGENYSLDVIVRDYYTHYIQISRLPSRDIVQIIPFDPADRSVAGVLTQETLDLLGKEGADLLAKVLTKELGAKEFLVVPKGYALPGYIQPEKSSFSRFRYADRQHIITKTSALLTKYKTLTDELDANYSIVLDEATLMRDSDMKTRYQEIDGILAEARFTPGKMKEYKYQDQVSRFRHACVEPILMLDKNRKIVGMLRALCMGNKSAYLSDEIMHQNIVPHTAFEGESSKEQEIARDLFLLAYLMHKACKLGLLGIDHLYIIAAQKREEIYDKIFKMPSALQDREVIVSLSDPGPLLQIIQKEVKDYSLGLLKFRIAEVKPSEKSMFRPLVAESAPSVEINSPKPSR